jgi:hypothetical protein
MILASGGLGDKSFNDSAYKGLLEAQKKFNIRFDTVKFATKEENLSALRSFARSNYDLIIGIRFENLENIQIVAEFPQIRFAEIDAELAGIISLQLCIGSRKPTFDWRSGSQDYSNKVRWRDWRIGYPCYQAHLCRVHARSELSG